MARRPGKSLLDIATETPGIIVRLPNWMGDILMTRSALLCLQERLQKPITALVPEHYCSLVNLFPEVDTVVALPRRRFPITSEPFRQLKQKIKDENWLGITFANSFRSALDLLQAGSTWRLGYPTDHRRGILTHWILPNPDPHRWEVKRFHDLVAVLTNGDHPMEIPKLLEPIRCSSEMNRNTSQNIVIHTGASKKPRRWPIHRYLSIARTCVEKGFQVRFITDEPIAVKESMYPGISFFCRIALEQLIDEIAYAFLFIGNDAGPAHLAMALGTPALVIYGPGHPSKHRPLGNGYFKPVTLNWPCSPCKQKFFKECKPILPELPACLSVLQTVEVRIALEQALEEIKEKH